MTRTRAVLLLLTVPLVLAGCAGEGSPPDTVGVVYCGSPLADHDVEQVEYRQDGEVVAQEELETGTPYRAEVPVGPATEVYVDGRLVGTSGGDPDGDVAGGYTALLGEGCPPYEEPPTP